MKIRTCIKIMMMLTVLSLVWGCGSGGSGGGGAAGTATTGKVVSKSTLAGPVSPSVMGVEITLVLPAGVTPQVDTNGQPLVKALAPNDVTATNGTLVALYTASSRTLKIVIARGSAPFIAGDFFSITCDVAAGLATPAAADFSYTGLKAFDNNGAEITTPVTATITVSGSTVGTGIAIPAKTALTSGLYDSSQRTYSSAKSAYAIKNISLGTDGSSLTETYSYWDPSNKAWSATLPAGIPASTFNKTTTYYLTSSGWVSGVSSAPSYTITFNTDGTAILTGKYDGATAKVSLTYTDISGLSYSTALGNSSVSLFPLVSTAPLLPSGSVRYNMTFDQLTDSYRTRDYDQFLSPVTNLSSVPSIFAEGSSTSQKVYIENNLDNTNFYALFGSGNSVNVYKQTFSSTSIATPALIGTATWAYKTVSGQDLLLISIPSALRNDYKLGWDPFFAVVNGVVKLGDYAIGGQTSYSNGGTSFNKVVADYIVANFNSAANGTIVAKAISKAILGF